MAYTRDPAALFAGVRRGRMTAPLNEDWDHSGAQPVPYRAAVLRRALGSYAAGEAVEFLDVHWRTGVARIYEDEQDVMNAVPSEVVHDAWPPAPPRPAAEYVAEAHALLARGHSLADARCRCAHGLVPARAAELGLAPSPNWGWGDAVATPRGALCLLPKAPARSTAAELSAELGVRDVRTAETAEGGSLLDALRACPHIAVAADGGGLAFACSWLHVGPLRGLRDLCRCVATAPLTCALPAGEAYVGMREHVRRLVAAGLVAELQGEGGRPLLHLLHVDAGEGADPRPPQPRADADIRALWDDSAPAPQTWVPAAGAQPKRRRLRARRRCEEPDC